jgi:ribosomal protein S6--L-glutamate ligase
VLYLQAYVEARADVRVFVVGDRVEASIMRRARPGEFRANIHQGAAFELFTPDAATAELAVRATRAVGLDYAGVDILLTDGRPQLLEVNGTPSFRAVNAASGRDMAESIVAHAVETAARRRLARGDAPTRFRPRRLRDHARALRRARGN